MRVALLGLRGVPGVAGGIETHCEQLCTQLEKIRPQDEFVVLGRRRHMPGGKIRIGRVTVIPITHAKSAKLETLTNTLAGVFYARFILHTELLHIHGICSAIFTPLAKCLGLKVIVTHHGRDYFRQKWSEPEKLFLRIGEWCGANFADAIIAVSPTIAAHLRDRYPAAHVKYIPNGADHICAALEKTADTAGLLTKLGLEPGQFVMSVGRLDPDKGFDDLIDAFLKSSAGGKLVIVGDDPRQSKYAKDLRSRAGERVIFTGFLPLPQIAGLLKYASLFVLPSRQEGFPIAPLEAAMIGAPIIVSDIPAARDLGLDKRHYFPVRDIDALCDMLNRPHEGYTVANRHLLIKFTWASISASTSATYDRVSGGQKAELTVAAE